MPLFVIQAESIPPEKPMKGVEEISSAIVRIETEQAEEILRRHRGFSIAQHTIGDTSLCHMTFFDADSKGVLPDFFRKNAWIDRHFANGQKWAILPPGFDVPTRSELAGPILMIVGNQWVRWEAFHPGNMNHLRTYEIPILQIQKIVNDDLRNTLNNMKPKGKAT